MTWDDVNRELVEIAAIADHAQRVGEYRRLLDGLPAGHEGRAEALMYLAEELKESGRLDEARDTYWLAIHDGGRTVLDAHVGVLGLELAAGDETRVDDLLRLLLTKSRGDQLVIGDYEWIGDLLEDAGRLRQALRWFTIPLRDLQPGDVDAMPVLALNGRYRVRRALGMPEDAYDDAHDLWHELNDSD